MELTNKEKVAILLLNLGAEQAADILGSFGEAEIEEISDIIGRMRSVDEATSIAVLNEFTQQFDSWRKSEEIIDVIKDHRPSIIPFRYFKHLTNEEVMTLLSGEHPQLVALVMSNLEPQQSADLIAVMTEEMKADVVQRMASSIPPPVQIIKQIDKILESKVVSLGDRVEQPNEKKYRTIAEILNRTDTATEKTIMQRMREEDPDIAQEIKTLMFVFEDVATVEDKALRKILGEINTATIAMAMKTASDAVNKKIFKNMSKRMGDMVKEEQSIMGPKPLSEVEVAQKEIVDALSKLESQGETVRGKASELGPMV